MRLLRMSHAIGQLTAEAFLTAPHSSGTEAAVLARLRESGDLAISLVADDGGAVVGHVACSPVRVGTDRTWLTLGPISVLPSRQGQGIGSALAEAGIARARAAGARGVMLVGDPGYYHRFGFSESHTMTLEGVPAEVLLELALEGAPPRAKSNSRRPSGAEPWVLRERPSLGRAW